MDLKTIIKKLQCSENKARRLLLHYHKNQLEEHIKYCAECSNSRQLSLFKFKPLCKEGQKYENKL